MSGGPWAVVGSLNLDWVGRVGRLPGADETVRVSELASVPGGHAGNCAMAIARLGARARLVAAVGDDPVGPQLMGALDRAGVDVSSIHTVPGHRTGFVFVPVLPDGERALYLVPGANDAIAAADIRRGVGDAARLIVFDPPGRLLHDLARLAESRLAVVAPGAGVLDGEAALAPLLRAARYLMVNRFEARLLSGSDDPSSAARRLSDRWPATVVVTEGRAGCWVADREGSLEHLPSFSVATVDSTGAGDAFVAGLAVALSEGQPVTSAARFASAVAALSTRALGAQGALPTRADADALLADALLVAHS